jgi:hypothetical protein
MIGSRFGACVLDRYDSLMPTTSVVRLVRPRNRRQTFCAAALLLASGLFVSACSNNTTTAPTTTTTTTSTSTVRERFTSTLAVGGTKFYSFSIATAGNVNATLESIGGAGVPSSVVVNMGIGSPFQTSCSANQSAVQVTGDAGLSAVVTGAQQPGVLCVIVADIGNLFAPATFTVVIDHP